MNKIKSDLGYILFVSTIELIKGVSIGIFKDNISSNYYVVKIEIREKSDYMFLWKIFQNYKLTPQQKDTFKNRI